MPSRILVVEDNPANLELMLYLLRAFGHESVAARTGAEGILRSRGGTFDLILMDLHMPCIDGFEAARHIRGTPKTVKVPIVAVTAVAMVGDREKVLRAGFDGYIAKPIEPQTFVSIVESFLPPERRGRVQRPVPGPAPAPEPAPPRAADRTSRSRRVVLVVDNAPDNLSLARSILEACGNDVETVSGGQAAIDRLGAGLVPDLIVSDVHMPKGSGWDLIRWVKEQDGLRKVPFVFISATVASEVDRKAAMALGADKFLVRPMDPPDFLAELAEYLAPAEGE